MKLHERLEAYEDLLIPWHVARILDCKTVRFFGDQATLSEEGDFANIDELREATAWLVDQLGGKVTWKKGKK